MTLAKLFPSATPRPWRTLDGDSVVNVFSTESRPIAATTTKAYFERFDAADKANAAAIVHAVNSFDQVVEALRSLTEAANDAMANGCFETTSDGPPMAVAIVNAEAALKAAKGA